MKVTMPTIVATAMGGKLNRKSLLLELKDNIECDVKEWHLSLQDLTIDFQLPPVDFLMCLEVCEHVPKEFEDKLLHTIDRHVNPGGTLVISWAVIGQGGFGHVNCQNNDYVISKFMSMNYSFDKTTSDYLRTQESCAGWFRNTILVFNKNV
jgi:cyclopropane fatty-acyl-phospholipid synthase-like methyltransferase